MSLRVQTLKYRADAHGIAMLTSYVAGALVLLQAFGWKRKTVPLLLLLLAPSVVLANIYCNVVQFIFLGLALALGCGRRFPAFAGVCCSVAWLKPSLALPFAALTVLFCVADRRRAALGFCCATVGWLGLTVATVGASSLTQWFAAMGGYARDMSSQPAINSLSGLYVRWAPAHVQAGLEGASVAVAALITGYVWLRRSSDIPPLEEVAWLWFLWFVATPYAHFPDQLLLTAPTLALVGRHGERLGSRDVLLMLYVLYGSVLLFSAAIAHVELLPVPTLVAMVALLAGSARRAGVQLDRAPVAS